ncbi:MAG: DUF4910 domain-containing protein [Symbiobacteriaceae bacterium]|nr:DUF4910 domain-containing protein [Symbiobacteriaceae bacterium]
MQQKIQLIAEHISPGRLLDYTGGIARHHRIQASQGHRDAAHYIAGVLKANGVEAQVLSYPSAYGIDYLGRKVFPEWNLRHAELTLVAPYHWELADFRVAATSVMQRSGPCDYSHTPLDIVLLDKGPQEELYGDIDLKGKIIFVRDAHNPYLDWAMGKRGALGVITDLVMESRNARTRHDQYDINRYVAFWYTEAPESMPFGFSLTPRQGDQLAALCKRMLAEHEADASKAKYPQATCLVDAQVVDGHLDVVEATLPGESDEEVWALAHLCHPRQSANDNASGCAANMEAISVLAKLLQQGKLKPLKRTLKIILMAEFTGTMPYLSDHYRPGKIKGAINLDMVGGKQELGYGPLKLVGLPISTPSYIADLAGLILEELKKEVSSGSPGAALPMFNSARVGFSGGSDQIILSDPLINIPCPQLGQNADVFYHTGGDTMDKISPHLIAKSSALAASYLYLLSNLEAGEVRPILDEMLQSYTKMALQALATFASGELLPPATALKIVTDYFSAATLTFKEVLPPTAELEAQLAAFGELLQTTSAALQKAYAICEAPAGKRSYTAVPKRTSQAVIIGIAEHATTPEKQAALRDYNENWGRKHGASTAANVIQYLIDGKRSIDEIADMVIFECQGGDREAVFEYLKLYRLLGFCEF